VTHRTRLHRSPPSRRHDAFGALDSKAAGRRCCCCCVANVVAATVAAVVVHAAAVAVAVAATAAVRFFCCCSTSAMRHVDEAGGVAVATGRHPVARVGRAPGRSLPVFLHARLACWRRPSGGDFGGVGHCACRMRRSVSFLLAVVIRSQKYSGRKRFASLPFGVLSPARFLSVET
jgi:hypothetical protein